MDFYTLYGSGWSAESIRKSIAERTRAPEEKLETAARYIRQYNSAYIPTQEQKEQQKHRREVQQQMVAKMTALLDLCRVPAICPVSCRPFLVAPWTGRRSTT